MNIPGWLWFVVGIMVIVGAIFTWKWLVLGFKTIFKKSPKVITPVVHEIEEQKNVNEATHAETTKDIYTVHSDASNDDFDSWFNKRKSKYVKGKKSKSDT